MAANNQINIVGRLTRDPEQRSLNNGDKVTGFALAVDRPGKDKATDFFEVSIFGRSGEAAAQYLRKGSWAAVSGRMTSRKHEDRTYWQVDAQDWAFVGAKPQDGPPAPQTGERERIKAQAQASGRWTTEQDDDEIPPF